jgi:hypothetical protein
MGPDGFYARLRNGPRRRRSTLDADHDFIFHVELDRPRQAALGRT